MKSAILVFCLVLLLAVGSWTMSRGLWGPEKSVSNNESDKVFGLINNESVIITNDNKNSMQETSTTTSPTSPKPAPRAGEVANSSVGAISLDSTRATLHTNKGNIVIAFSSKQAPNTATNFLKLAQSKFYDGTKFHRVIKGFMIQGGDPLTKDDSKMAQWGTGGPGYKFNDEIGANNINLAGTVVMANSGPNTNGSQFFINAVDNHSLDSGYTVFGRVVAGMDIVTLINNVPTNSSDRPLDPVVVQSVTLQ